MNKIIPIILLMSCMLCGIGLQAAKIVPMPELMKPDKIEAWGDRLYISDGTSIHIYSLKDLKYVKKFGKSGEGPGEITIDPTLGNLIIDVDKKYVMVNSVGKLLFFKHDGTFVSENRFKGGVLGMYYMVGDRFTAAVFTQREKGIFQAIALFDPDLHKTKEIYAQKYFIQREGKIDLLKRPMQLYTNDTRIVADTGLSEILLFDASGKKIKTIVPDTKKIEVTSEHKKKVIDYMKTDHHAKQYYHQMKHRITFPDTLMPVRLVTLTEDKIYLQTHTRKKGNMAEFMIYDLDGKFLKRAFYPVVDDLLNQQPKYDIYKGMIYEIVENLEDEEWELHAGKL